MTALIVTLALLWPTPPATSTRRPVPPAAAHEIGQRLPAPSAPWFGGSYAR